MLVRVWCKMKEERVLVLMRMGVQGRYHWRGAACDKNGATVSHSMSYSYPYDLKPQKNDIPLVFQGVFPYIGTSPSFAPLGSKASSAIPVDSPRRRIVTHMLRFLHRILLLLECSHTMRMQRDRQT